MEKNPFPQLIPGFGPCISCTNSLPDPLKGLAFPLNAGDDLIRHALRTTSSYFQYIVFPWGSTIAWSVKTWRFIYVVIHLPLCRLSGAFPARAVELNLGLCVCGLNSTLLIPGGQRRVCCTVCTCLVFRVPLPSLPPASPKMGMLRNGHCILLCASEWCCFSVG